MKGLISFVAAVSLTLGGIGLMGCESNDASSPGQVMTHSSAEAMVHSARAPKRPAIMRTIRLISLLPSRHQLHPDGRHPGPIICSRVSSDAGSPWPQASCAKPQFASGPNLHGTHWTKSAPWSRGSRDVDTRCSDCGGGDDGHQCQQVSEGPVRATSDLVRS